MGKRCEILENLENIHTCNKHFTRISKQAHPNPQCAWGQISTLSSVRVGWLVGWDLHPYHSGDIPRRVPAHSPFSNQYLFMFLPKRNGENKIMPSKRITNLCKKCGFAYNCLLSKSVRISKCGNPKNHSTNWNKL